MRQIKILILYIFFAFLMYGCTNMSEAKRVLKGEKKQTDESHGPCEIEIKWFRKKVVSGRTPKICEKNFDF